MISSNDPAQPRGRPLLAAGVAAGIASFLAFVWLEIAEAPLVGQPVLYAGGIILLFSPLMWLGFFLVVLPSSIVAFRPEGQRFAGGSLAIFALLPLGCVLLIPGIMIVASHYQEKMQDEARDQQRQHDAAMVTEVFEQGGDLRQFKNRSQGTEQALGEILGKADGPQLHLLTSAYMDDSQLMEWMANSSRVDPEDLRSIFAHYRDAPPGERPIMADLAKNSRTPTDVLLQLATPRYGYISLRNPNFPASERLKILQNLTVGDAKARYMVADSPYATPGMLEKLASDVDVSVRTRVAQNPSTPLSALEVLARDKEAVVSNLAMRALQISRRPVKP